MFKKMFHLGVLLLCMAGLANISVAQNYRSIKAPILTVNDNTAPVSSKGKVVSFSDQGPVSFSVNSIMFNTAETDTNVRTLYDLQSNGNIRDIIQDPSNPMNLHATCIVSKDQAYATRNTPYIFSSDGGTTWQFLGDPNTARAGFPCIGLTTDGRAIIMNHSAPAPNTVDVRAVIFLDLAPGIGSFDLLDPGVTNTLSDPPIWPNCMTTPSNKIVFAGSEFTAETTFVNVCTNLTPPGTFSGYQQLLNAGAAEVYAVATTTGSKVGLAYISGSFSSDPVGTVYFKQSTDDGATFGAEQQIYVPNYVSGDSMGAIRDVDITYLNGEPCVVFGIALQDGTGNYFPNGPAKIQFWSPNINGGNPVTVDSLEGTTGSGNGNVNDVFVCVTRASIGRSADGNALYIAYNKARSDTSELGVNYFDVYFTYSSDGGATWVTPVPVTNQSGPLRDCRYVAISPTNDFMVNGPHYAYMLYQADSIAGSSVNGAGFSFAHIMFAKATITDPIGVKNIGNNIPGSYQLYQNYPNPFNPTTKIKFDLPKNGFVNLKVYDILGREVAVLVNQELQAGSKEYEFNAVNLPSGVYFYKLKAGDFTATKKLVLVK